MRRWPRWLKFPSSFRRAAGSATPTHCKVEIQQASGNPVSPENQSDEDLKLIAISSLMNAEPDRTVPLLEKVLSDPKNNLGLKSRALFVLAQNRSDKAREIVTQYAKSGANPDLQIRAVQYLGTFRSPASQQALADVYAANNDVALRRAVSAQHGQFTRHPRTIRRGQERIECRSAPRSHPIARLHAGGQTSLANCTRAKTQCGSEGRDPFVADGIAQR